MKRVGVIVGLAAIVAGCGDLPAATYSMSSASMLPTLQEGDILGADQFKGDCGHARATPGQVVILRRGDVVHVARAIAGPGQTLVVKAGRLSIDGAPVRTEAGGRFSIEGPFGPQDVATYRETLANGATYLTLDFGPDGELDNFGPVTLKDAWFVMGDSRDNAADSRVYGPTPVGDICAVVTSIVSSKDKSRVGQRP